MVKLSVFMVTYRNNSLTVKHDVEDGELRVSYIHLVWSEFHQLQVLHAVSSTHPGPCS